VEQDYGYVVTGDFVSTEDGSGIVHIAPAFGADDMEVGKNMACP
jgi:isoleucyl-tRNA synthetase